MSIRHVVSILMLLNVVFLFQRSVNAFFRSDDLEELSSRLAFVHDSKDRRLQMISARIALYHSSLSSAFANEVSQIVSLNISRANQF